MLTLKKKNDNLTICQGHTVNYNDCLAWHSESTLPLSHHQ